MDVALGQAKFPAEFADAAARRAACQRLDQREGLHDCLFHGFPLRRTFQIMIQLLIRNRLRSEEHTSELQSLMRISYAVFCLKKKKKKDKHRQYTNRYVQ